MIKRHLYLFCSLCLLTIGCQQNSEDPYQARISTYFMEVHQLNLEKELAEKKVLLLPLNGCNPCLEEIMQYSITNSIQVNNILFVGNPGNEKLTVLSDAMDKNYKTIWDKENKLGLYRTNIHSPSILRIHNGKLYKKELSLNNYVSILNDTSL